MGQMLEVEIIEVGKFFMKGKVLPASLASLPATPIVTSPISLSGTAAAAKQRGRVTIHNVYSDNCDVEVEKKSKENKCEDDDGECCGGTCDSDKEVEDYGHDHHHTHEDDHGYSSDDEHESADPPPRRVVVETSSHAKLGPPVVVPKRNWQFLGGFLVALIGLFLSLYLVQHKFVS